MSEEYFPRTRTLDERSRTVKTTKIGTAPTVTTYPGYSGTISTMQDWPHRGFRKTLANGGLVFGNCCLTRVTRSFTPGTTYSVGFTTLETYSGDRGPLNMPIQEPAYMQNPPMVDALLIEAYAKMNSTPVLAGEILSDLGKTVGMLASPFRSASQLLTRMVKYRAKRMGKTTRSAAKATADSWLEYRYGWQPIILDVQGIVKIAEKHARRNDQPRLVARAGKTLTFSKSEDWGPTGENLAGSCSVSRKIRCDVGVMYCVKATTSLDYFADQVGFSNRSVPATIWEQIPYSFVVDWFVNVGDWIQAVTPNPGISVLGNWGTTINERVVNASQRVKYPGTVPTKHYAGDYGTECITTSVYNRRCNLSVPLTPALTATSLSTLHQADAMALVAKPILGLLKSFRH